jgi:hypothetical protein
MMTSPTGGAVTPNIKDAIGAAWRKAVAAAVGYALAYLARRWHIVLDADTSQAGVMFAVALLGTIYGALVNFAEIHVPKLGWFLGLARQPKFLKVTPPGQANRTLDGVAVEAVRG